MARLDLDDCKRATERAADVCEELLSERDAEVCEVALERLRAAAEIEADRLEESPRSSVDRENITPSDGDHEDHEDRDDRDDEGHQDDD